jgi:hypothetical protein
MKHIRSRMVRIATSEAGMTTAEYAVGTVAAAGFGGLLYKVLTSGTVLQLLSELIAKALSWVFGG